MKSVLQAELLILGGRLISFNEQKLSIEISGAVPISLLTTFKRNQFRIIEITIRGSEVDFSLLEGVDLQYVILNLNLSSILLPTGFCDKLVVRGGGRLDIRNCNVRDLLIENGNFEIFAHAEFIQRLHIIQISSHNMVKLVPPLTSYRNLRELVITGECPELVAWDFPKLEYFTITNQLKIPEIIKLPMLKYFAGDLAEGVIDERLVSLADYASVHLTLYEGITITPAISKLKLQNIYTKLDLSPFFEIVDTPINSDNVKLTRSRSYTEGWTLSIYIDSIAVLNKALLRQVSFFVTMIHHVEMLEELQQLESIPLERIYLIFDICKSWSLSLNRLVHPWRYTIIFVCSGGCSGHQHLQPVIFIDDDHRDIQVASDTPVTYLLYTPIIQRRLNQLPHNVDLNLFFN